METLGMLAAKKFYLTDKTEHIGLEATPIDQSSGAILDYGYYGLIVIGASSGVGTWKANTELINIQIAQKL